MAIVHLSDTLPEPKPVILDPLEPTIFHEPWWLEITTNGGFKVAEVRDNGSVVGRLPYFPRRKYGITFSTMPMLTHFLGPAIVDGSGKSNNRILKRMDITHELIRSMDPMSRCQIKCYRDITDVIAFQANNFWSTVQFTHEIKPQSADLVWKNMRDKGRNAIRLAREHATIDRAVDPAEFIKLYSANLVAKGKDNYLNMEQTKRLVEATTQRERGQVFGARNAAGELICAIFCVWDSVSYYYLMTTRAEDSHRGVANLLVWEAITDAMARGLIFDFDGVANEGNARMTANFTSDVSPRYVVTRETWPVQLWMTVQSIVKPPNYFCD